jgi:hypothetical protein
MRYTAALILGFGLLMSGCASRDEVLRLTSPDGRTDAIVYETDCGVLCSFGYEIELAPKGGHGGDEVASVLGAVRNERAYGVDLKWQDADSISIEYLRAEYPHLLKQTADIAGHKITISLRGGVYDSQAPGGGMEYNLHEKPRN